MEKELDELISKYEEGNMSLLTLKTELLRLFSVVGRSEQLPCVHKQVELVRYAAKCKDCGTVFETKW